MPAAPKVFISHASEDKERFVVKFAQRLRENGVDAWLDQWEMQPGDSLVDKIFEQGLKDAQAVILVISAASIVKPWVREELNLSVVKRISQGTKLIPVVIDQCEVPQALQSTIWQRIDDLNNCDAAFQRILAAIFNTSEKPALGKAPEKYVAPAPVLPTFTVGDERVFKSIEHYEVEQSAGPVSFGELRADESLKDISDDDLQESLFILAQKNVIHLEQLGDGAGWASLTLSGFQQYADAFIGDYKESLAKIGAMLINENVADNHELAKRTGKPQAFVNYVLDVFADADHIVLAKFGGGLWEIAQINPSLKRAIG
jgi:TIR domain